METGTREILLSLATAMAAGLVIGAEREQAGKSSFFAGVRTFPICGLAGAIGMLVGPWLLVSLSLGLGALVGVAYYRESDRRNEIGISTEVAALVTFALGALCTARDLDLPVTNRLLIVAASATVVLALLSVKKPLHGFLARVNETDVYATVKLLAISVIVLPLLPDQAMGPWGALNPFAIGLLVALISAVSFAGYVAVRALGPRRGLGLTGLLGGLASSTAVTLSFAGRAKEKPELTTSCAVAILLACGTMFARMVVAVAAASPALLSRAVWPLGAAGLASYAAAGLLYFRATQEARRMKDDQIQLTNPLTLASALKFAFLFTVVLLLSKAASVLFSDAGTYLSAVLGGSADVDAITLSLARLHRAGLAPETAVLGICLAALSNTIVKIALALFLGGKRLGATIGAALGASAVVGAVVYAVT